MNLYFNIADKWVEPEYNIKDEDVIALNYTFESLVNPTKYISDYSYNINIPRTPNNNKLFNQIYRLDKVDNHLNKKIDYIYQSKGDIISVGTATLSEINQDYYIFSLNGSLSTILNKLINSGWKITEDENYYQLPDEYLNGNVLNTEIVNNSFLDDNFNFDFETFENLEDKFSQLAGFIPTNFMETENFNKNKWLIGNRITDVGKLDDSATLDVNIDEDDLNNSNMAEFRCYNLRPYVYVTRLWQLFQKYCKQITDYDLVLDSRWFNKSYGFLRDLIYTLPKLDTTNATETNQYTEEFENYFSSPFDTVLTYNKTITSTNTITCSGANKAIFEWSIPFEWRFTVLDRENTKFFNPKYAVKLTAKIKNDDNTYLTKTYIYLPILNDTDENGNYTSQTQEFYKQNWRNAGYEIIEYVYDTEQREEGGFIKCKFGYFNGKIIADNLENAVIELNLSFVLNPQYQIITSNQPVFNLSADFITCTLDTEALIDTTLLYNNGYKSKFNLERLFGDVNPFSILLKYSKINCLFWMVNDYDKTIKVIRKSDFFFDCLSGRGMDYKMSNTYPFNGIYDITKFVDFNTYSILPLSWQTRDITLNFAEGDEKYGKPYYDKYKQTYGSVLLHTDNKTNNENTNLLCTNEFDNVNPAIFSAEYISPLYNILNDVNVKMQDDNYLVDNENVFCYRLKNSTYNSDIRINGYRVDSNGSYVLISGDSNKELESNIYCWHYNSQSEDIKCYARPVFSECNDIGFAFLFAQPYESYATTYPASKSIKYLYNENFKYYFNELYNKDNKTIEVDVHLPITLFLRIKANPFVMIGNICYIVLNITDWKGSGVCKCKLRQITQLNYLTMKSLSKNIKKIELNELTNNIQE